MPKQEAMAQLSRPFQIALVAVCLLAGVWLFALQGHHSSSSEPATTASTTPAATPPASASASASTTPATQSGPTAPGEKGLSRAVAKAHEAVSDSQQSAKHVEGESAEGANAPAAVATTRAASAAKPATTSKSATPSQSASAAAATTPARQQAVETAVAGGDIAVLLFWDPRGSDDRSVRSALSEVQKTDKHVAVQVALPSQVATFGTVTRGVQIYGTPTLLFVNKSGQALQLTGLQDAFSIEQTILEARKA
jgi:hypothetical protein